MVVIIIGGDEREMRERSISGAYSAAIVVRIMGQDRGAPGLAAAPRFLSETPGGLDRIGLDCTNHPTGADQRPRALHVAETGQDGRGRPRPLACCYTHSVSMCTLR